jgi:predicted secreted protein
MAYTPKLNDYFLGREVDVEIFLGESETPPQNYLELGGTRGLNREGSKGTVDVTNRDTPGNVRQTLVDYISMTGSIDGVVTKGDESNVKATERYFYETNQSFAWVRLTAPDGGGATEVCEIPCQITECSKDFANESEATFSLSWEAVEEPQFTDVPAP